MPARKKIVFIIPPIIDMLWTHSSDLLYLGAAGLAARLLAEGHDVSAIDCAVDCRGVKELKARLGRLRPDLAAIPLLYGTVPNGYKAAAAAKECGAAVVFGGLPATFSAERLLAECPQADYCVLGEGELALSALAAGRDPASVPGLAWRRAGVPVSNGPGEKIADLDSLPLPARHLFPQERYKVYSLRTFRQVPTTNIETKRGCPYACEFCLQTPKEGRAFRLRSPERVVDELLRVRRDFPFIRRAMFIDNDFLAPYDHGVAVLDGIIAAGLHRELEFMAAARLDNFLKGGDALIDKFARANVSTVYFGIESVNGRNRERLRKVEAGCDTAALLERMRRRGVHSMCSYIFGFENEGREDMLETVRAAMRDGPSLVKFNILTPYPGTRTHADCAARGALPAEIPLWQYDNAHQLARHPEDCAAFFRSAYRRYYYSPSQLAKVRWTAFAGPDRDMRLLSLLQHVAKRELLGRARDAWRAVKYGLLGSQDFVG